jgi:Asp-tRNA(Asn)/Glu-tRNA(Gln) amidotransferase B subunit
MHSAEEAGLFITELRKLVRWINICDGNMEEGSLRCDANVSVRLKGETKLGTKVEVKNLNSMRNVRRAIEFEIERMIGLLEKGKRSTSKQEALTHLMIQPSPFAKKKRQMITVISPNLISTIELE